MFDKTHRKFNFFFPNIYTRLMRVEREPSQSGRSSSPCGNEGGLRVNRTGGGSVERNSQRTGTVQSMQPIRRGRGTGRRKRCRVELRQGVGPDKRIWE